MKLLRVHHFLIEPITIFLDLIDDLSRKIVKYLQITQR